MTSSDFDKAIDLSSGISTTQEAALEKPVELYRFAENYMFTGYDPALDLGLWLHLGTTPDDFGIWEDQVGIALPGDQGCLWLSAYHRTPPAKRPAGANLVFQCIEPFRRWRLTCEGRAVISSNHEMLSGRLRDGAKELFSFELDVRCVTPAWDAHHNASSVAGSGSMREQVWASAHYQQLYALTGTVRWRGHEERFNGTGVRDHSRGQRGHAYERYGGHNLFSVLFPSGRGFGMMEMWDPRDKITLSVGYVAINDRLHHGTVTYGPRFTQILPAGESLAFGLRTDVGEYEFNGTIIKTLLATQESPYGLSWGADTEHGRGIYSPSFGRWEWDGKPAMASVKEQIASASNASLASAKRGHKDRTLEGHAHGNRIPAGDTGQTGYTGSHSAGVGARSRFLPGSRNATGSFRGDLSIA